MLVYVSYLVLGLTWPRRCYVYESIPAWLKLTLDVDS